jgi:hypothetical protein
VVWKAPGLSLDRKIYTAVNRSWNDSLGNAVWRLYGMRSYDPQLTFEEQPQLTRVGLVDRFQEELLSGISLPDTNGLADSPLLDRITHNTQLLKHCWFVTRCRTFHALPGDAQGEFLDTQLLTIEQWVQLEAQISQLAASRTDSDPLPTGEVSTGIADFFDEVEEWVRNAKNEQQTLNDAVVAGTLRWLSTSSLEEQSLGLRIELAQRITYQLEHGQTLPELAEHSPLERSQLQSNCQLLGQAWLYDQAQQYAELPASERPAFIDARLEALQGWNLASLLPSDGDSKNWLVVFQQFITSAVQNAPVELRPQVEDLRNDAQQRLLMRWFLPQ